MEKDLEKEILERMELIAERPTRYNCEWDKSELSGFIDLNKGVLKIRGFKPTLTDKLLFKKILEKNEKIIQKRYNQMGKNETNMDGLADLSRYLYIVNVGFYLMSVFFSK